MSFKNDNEPVLNTSETCAIFTKSKIPIVKFCRNCQIINEGRSSCFSMANLEEIHETELDTILGELNSLDQIICPNMHNDKYCIRLNNTDTTSPSSLSSDIVTSTDLIYPNHRTESPDNDSAFSDTLSLLSSESSASSNISSTNNIKQGVLLEENRIKVAKIQLALFKLEHATVKRLLIKAFTADGASKSVLVDERMTCGQITRMLADKNHVEMQSSWALVENRNDLYIERFYEDHELLIDNIKLWDSNSKVRLLFLQLAEKSAFFETPENFLPSSKKFANTPYDDTKRKLFLEEFFNISRYLPVDGYLFLKNDIKKGWKKYNFVLRESGLYYFPKEKKTSRDAVCLATFHDHFVYKGIGWKKKFKSPNDFGFAFKNFKNLSLKMLCAEDSESLEKWVTAIRIAKYGKQLFHNYMNLVEDIKISQHENSFNSSKCGANLKIPFAVPTSESDKTSYMSSNTGRVSRASSSSSSGCLSDDNGFDSEFTTGTIKRKPSMKPKLPLTTMTRQLKEVGEIRICDSENNTLTRRHKKNKNPEICANDSLQKCQYLMSEDLSCFSSTSNDASISASRSSSFDSYDRCSESLSECNSLNFSNKEECHSSVSTTSLESLPPPPPLNDYPADFYGSQTSLSSLPLPPPPPSSELDIEYLSHIESNLRIAQKETADKEFCTCPNEVNVNEIPTIMKTTMSTVKNTNKRSLNSAFRSQNMSSVSKTVSFADSSSKQKLYNEFHSQNPAGHFSMKCKDMFPQTYDVKNKCLIDLESSKNSNDSAASPSKDFLKDLQRVMRKKWQVAQKCKLEPATSPHEVLGFRDFSGELCNNYKNFYRETANVSNWVQEHYGSGANYGIYENFNEHSVKLPLTSPSMLRKKRPPPPPPKRSDSTHLTHRV